MIYEVANIFLTIVYGSKFQCLDLCDYSDAYVDVNGGIDLWAAAVNENDRAEKIVVFKNNAPFRSCISKIDSILIDNPDDLDIVMPMLICYNIVKIIVWYQEIYGIIIETKSMMLMIMLQMVNHLNIKQK